MSLISEIPLWWLPIIALIALAVSIWYYRKKDWVKEIAPLLRSVLIGLRFLSLFLIAVLLLGILIESITYKEEKPVFLTLVDNSSSMLNYEDSAGVLTNIKTYHKEVSGKFGDKFTYETVGLDLTSINVDSLSFNETSTDLDVLLKGVYNQYYNRNVGGIVLISDGNYNRGSNPVYSGEKFKFVPIYTLGVGDTIQKKDALINAVLANDIAFLGNKFPIEVTVEGHKILNERSLLRISRDGKVLKEEEIIFKGEVYDLLKFNFIVDADKIGFSEYIVEIVPLNNESNYQNNLRSLYIEVLDARSKVLLLANGPHPDLGAIKNTLVQDNNLEIITKRKLDNPAMIKEFDLIIWHEPEKGFSDELLNQIKTHKKSVWFIIGPNTSGNIMRRLPIGIASNIGRQSDEVQAAYNDQFTRFEFSQKAKERISEFPPLVTHYGELSLNKNADVFLYQRVGPVKKKDPLFFFVTENNQKYGVTYGEGLWRWRLADYMRNQNQLVFDEIVNKTVQYLMVNANSSKLRVTMPREFLEGEDVIVGASFYNESMEPITSVPIEFTLQFKEEELRYNFSPTETSYSLNLGSLEAGAYTWEAATAFEGKSHTKSGSFLVRRVELEAMNTKSNFMLLNQLSSNTNASFFPLSQYRSLIDEVNTRDDFSTVSSPTTTYHKLIDYIWWFVLLILLLTTEWFIRRYSGGY